MTRSPQLALIGGTFWGNRGAEAMLAACIGRSRERHPGARFKVYSYYPNEDARLVNDPAVEILDGRPSRLCLVQFPFALACALLSAFKMRLPDALLPRAVRVLRECDVTCDVQGISFDDGRLLFLPFKVLSVWPSLLLGVPVVKLSQAMGPFRQPINRMAARWFLMRCHRSYGRGRTTAAFLEDLRLPNNRWGVAADLAFSFQCGDSLSDENADRLRETEAQLLLAREEGKAVVALAPSSLVLKKTERRGGDYAGAMVNIIRCLAVGDQHVVVLPNATREGVRKARNNDLYAMEKIAVLVQDTLPPRMAEKVLWVDYDLNTDGIRRILRHADALISSRFHAMVAGLSLGIPTLVVGWSHKYAEVLADFDCERYAVDFDDTTVDLVKFVREFLDRRSDIRARIKQAQPAVRASSATQFSFLDELLV